MFREFVAEYVRIDFRSMSCAFASRLHIFCRVILAN